MYHIFISFIFSLLLLLTPRTTPGTDVVEQNHPTANENQTKKILPSASCQKKGGGKKPTYSTQKMRKSSNPEKYTKQKQEFNEILQGSYSGNMSLGQLKIIRQRINRATSAPELRNNNK